MRSDYEVIRADNIREYGEGTRHLEFLGQLYSDRTHFVYELLQNAEDKGAKQIKFDLFQDRLEFLHDGSPFMEADIRGICGVGQGTKTEDLTKIGKFGVGFKSVYAYTSKPHIHCGDDHFLIEHYVRPYEADEVMVPEGWTTRFVFPFDNEAVPAEKAFQEIIDRLRHLSVRTLLFLTTIQEVLWCAEGGESGYYVREVKSGGVVRRVAVTGAGPDPNKGVEEETWLVFTRAVATPDGRATRPVEIAYLLGKNGAHGEGEEIKALHTSPLFVFFATEKDTRLGFLAQGPYKTTPARDNIPKDDRWNEFLIKETGKLVAASLIILRDRGLMSVRTLEAMPIDQVHFPLDSMFRPIYDAVAAALKVKALLPAEGGSYVSAKRAVLGRGAEIRRLLSPDQLAELLAEVREGSSDGIETMADEDPEASLRWLSGEISHDRTPGLRGYLLTELGIEEVSPELFARRVSKAFLETQPDSWFVSFYRFLLKQEALWKPSKTKWSGDGPLRFAPIIRLEDGCLASAFDEDGVAAVYVRGGTSLDLPYVKQVLTEDDEAAEFLERLGLRPPDVVSQVIEHVLPYYTADVIDVSVEEHLSHVRLISEAMSVGTVERRSQLKSRLLDAPWVFARSAETNARGRVEPTGAYFDHADLRVFLGGNPEVWFLDEIYDEASHSMLRELGVRDCPDIRQRPVDRRGFVLVFDMHGRHVRGRDGFDPDCEVKHLKFAIEHPTIERSVFIWNQLALPLKNQIRGKVESSSRKSYEDSRVGEQVSKFGELLLESSWMPVKDGGFVTPSAISPIDLPSEFEPDEFLARQLSMAGSDLGELAKKSGFDLEDLDLIRVLKTMPEELQKIRERLEQKKTKPEFPQRSSVNPERRVRQAELHAEEAPERRFEERTRSVRVSSPPVGKVAYLRQSYTNDDGQLVCQLCHDEMPFRGRDGEYYFEAVQLVDDLVGEHAANHVALCPLCSAKFRELIKKDEQKSESLKTSLTDSSALEVGVMLGDDSGTLRFVEKHLLDVQGILAAEDSIVL